MLVGNDLADAIRSAMGFPLPLSTQLIGWGNGVVTHIQNASVVAFASGNVTGIAPASGGALTNGAATDGMISGLVGSAMANLVKADAGYPFVSAQLNAFCGAIVAHIMTNGKCQFASGTVTGNCTNTVVSPGTFTGTGNNGTLTGLIGAQLASEVHSAVGYPGSVSSKLIQFCTALTTYVMANAVVSGGSMTGTAPAGGGAITAGSGSGGTIA